MVYTKLFSDILASTVWAESDHTRIVWITMLAMADRDGNVMGSVPGLAHIARVPIAACEAALAALAAPDKDSRTKTNEGRRIEPIDGGWFIINYEKHRERRSAEDRREQDRRRQQRKRERDMSRKVTPVTPAASASASAAASAAAVPLGPTVPLNGEPSSLCGADQRDDQSRNEGRGPSGTGQRGNDAEVEQVVLFKAMWPTSYRRNSQHRHMDITDAVVRLHAVGITPDDLLTLAKKAAARGAKPAGLFAHWVDNPDEACKELGRR